MTTVKLSDKHLRVIETALEAYARAHLGQFGTMIDEIFPANKLAWENRDEIEKFLKARLMSELNSGYHGIHSKAVRDDAKIAFEIRQSIRQYLAVKNNDGYFDHTFVTYDDPPLASKEPLPEIVDFVKHKDFVIDDPKIVKKLDRLFNQKKYKEMWDIVKEQDFYKQTDGSEWQILPQENKTFILRVNKPSKKQDAKVL
jgi:hypothetical protein